MICKCGFPPSRCSASGSQDGPKRASATSGAGGVNLPPLVPLKKGPGGTATADCCCLQQERRPGFDNQMSAVLPKARVLYPCVLPNTVE